MNMYCVLPGTDPPLLVLIVSFVNISKRKSKPHLENGDRKMRVIGIYILICSFWLLFCLLIFFPRKEKHNWGTLYDKLPMSGWQGERERPEAQESNTKWVPNHMERSTGSHSCPHEVTVHFGTCVCCLVF